MNVRDILKNIDADAAAEAALASDPGPEKDWARPQLRAAWREIKSLRPVPSEFRLRLRPMPHSARPGEMPTILVSGLREGDDTPHAMDLVPWEEWLAMEVEIDPRLEGLDRRRIAGRLLREMTVSGCSRKEIAARREALGTGARALRRVAV